MKKMILVDRQREIDKYDEKLCGDECPHRVGNACCDLFGFIVGLDTCGSGGIYRDKHCLAAPEGSIGAIRDIIKEMKKDVVDARDYEVLGAMFEVYIGRLEEILPKRKKRRG